MTRETLELPHEILQPPPAYRAPAFEVISLDCEITSYAPEGGDPLF